MISSPNKVQTPFQMRVYKLVNSGGNVLRKAIVTAYCAHGLEGFTAYSVF